MEEIEGTDYRAYDAADADVPPASDGGFVRIRT